MATSSADKATLEATLEAQATLAVTPASVEVTPPVFTKEQQEKFAEKEAFHAQIEKDKNEMLFYYNAYVEQFLKLETDEEKENLNYQAYGTLRAMQSQFLFRRSRLGTSHLSYDSFFPKGTGIVPVEPVDDSSSALKLGGCMHDLRALTNLLKHHLLSELWYYEESASDKVVFYTKACPELFEDEKFKALVDKLLARFLANH